MRMVPMYRTNIPYPPVLNLLLIKSANVRHTSVSQNQILVVTQLALNKINIFS